MIKESINIEKNNTGTLFSILAHDLKTPVNNIICFANLLNAMLEDSHDEDFAKFINVIEREAEHVNNLITFLWEWGKNTEINISDHDKIKLQNILENFKTQHEAVFA